jgi:hypothetical protein
MTTSSQTRCSISKQSGYKVNAQLRHTARHNLLKFMPSSKRVTGLAPPSVHMCKEFMFFYCQLSKTNEQIYRLTAATPKRKEQSKDLQTSQRLELLASSFQVRLSSFGASIKSHFLMHLTPFFNTSILFSIMSDPVFIKSDPFFHQILTPFSIMSNLFLHQSRPHCPDYLGRWHV